MQQKVREEVKTTTSSQSFTSLLTEWEMVLMAVVCVCACMYLCMFVRGSVMSEEMESPSGRHR